MRDPLAGLNEEQRQVVTTTEGPVLVLAGAGSGKTRALTHRLAYLIAAGCAKPQELLAVTFTNKAAREMRHRISDLVGPAVASAVACSTFHSLGARLLREQWRHTRRSAGFTILDAGDSERLIKHILDQHQISAKQWSPRSLARAISKAKNSLISPADFARHVDSTFTEVAATVYTSYQTELARHDSYDFDDLIGELLSLLQNNASVRQHYQTLWRYVSIDEYQDTNPPQEALIRQLLHPQPNLCVVGDDYQAIYSWRGAQVDHILRFEQKYPACTTIYLTQNYRSTPAILAAANAVIAENAEQKHKKLWTAREAGSSVALVAVNSDREEAQLVRQAIERYRAAGGKARDCAVLYRTNAQSRLFEESFVTAGIPYTIVGGLRFYDRAEIKDALALAHFLVNPRGGLALQRIVRAVVRGVGPKTITRLTAAAQARGQDLLSILSDQELLTARQRAALAPLVNAYTKASQQLSVREQIFVLLEMSGYLQYLLSLPDGEDRRENIEEFLNVAAGYNDLVGFVEAVSLLSDIDTPAVEQDRVLCMTLHAAKGLEFTNVWVVGLEEGLLPHKNSADSQAELEEERRLLYVGMTRAREQLTLSYALARTIHGQHLPQLPSRFLEALPTTDLERIQVVADGFLNPLVGSDDVVYSSHEVGDIVTHPVFGRGVVIQTQGNTLTAVFEGYGVKTYAAVAN